MIVELLGIHSGPADVSRARGWSLSRDGTDWRVINNMLNRTSNGIFNASYELGGPKGTW